MKTLDMFNKLEANPKQKFQCIDDYGHTMKFYTNGTGYLFFERYDHGGKLISSNYGGGGFNGNLRFDYEWELVKEPVSWQEAIRAWIEIRKGFYIECGGNTYRQLKHRRLGCLRCNDKDVDGFDSEMFENGKWYIEQ